MCNYSDSVIDVAMRKADNLDIELIEPTGPGLYWQFRSLCHASFNPLAQETGTTPSFEKKMCRLGVGPNENSMRSSDGDSVTDLDQDNTLDFHIQISKSR